MAKHGKAKRGIPPKSDFNAWLVNAGILHPKICCARNSQDKKIKNFTDIILVLTHKKLQNSF